jgi:hypothetical protein
MTLNRRALDWLVPLAASRPNLSEALVNILLGAQPAPEQGVIFAYSQRSSCEAVIVINQNSD